ncbi:MAG: DUF3291 domain-containing protein [Flavobacteriaceae bacterium]
MNYHLAQINVAKMIAPLNSEIMVDFVNNLARINALAETSEGFVWRLKDDADNATTIKVFEDEFMIVNMSVWESKIALFNFTYSSAHVEIFKRRKEWFSKMTDSHIALWYVPADQIPNPKEAVERLYYLNEHGETPFSFSFKNEFNSDDALTYERKNRK